MKIFIPVKEVSQRVPKKNFRVLKGKTLWRHCVDKFENCGIRVFLDTDSDEIISECEDLNWVTAFKRQEHLQGHRVSVIELLKDFKDRFVESDDEIIAQLHVTSPFFRLGHLTEGIQKMKLMRKDSAFSVDVIQNRLWRDESYGICPVNHNPMKLEQTQDLPKIYMENSYFYIFKAGILNGNNRIGHDPITCEVPYPYNLDIDTEQDWKIIESVKIDE